jgi:tagaturonate reductase
VIPTELVHDNGPRLNAMVNACAARFPRGAAFRAWLAERVRFCSSLVDRITTGDPEPREHARLGSTLGYRDALLTATEPALTWAIEADPDELQAAFPIHNVPGVVVAPDIGFYRERKLRLLNGAHSAMAPLAILSGVDTVAATVDHSRLGPALRRLLFAEIAQSTSFSARESVPFAARTLERFRNPWLQHRWTVIATNQTAKFRARVVPSIVALTMRWGRAPEALALACAAYLRWARCIERGEPGAGAGSWRGARYPIHDADLELVARHWRAVEPAPDAWSVRPELLTAIVARALPDDELWGRGLADLPGLEEAVGRWLRLLEQGGVAAALDALAATPVPALPVS